jgi:hypothetical protein
MNLAIESKKIKSLITEFFYDMPKESSINTTLYTLRLVRSPDDTMKEIFDSLKANKLVLAGGAITSLFSAARVNDLDFYMEDLSKKDAAVAFLSKFFKEPPYISENCITFKRKSSKSRKAWTVQLITRFSGSPEELFDNFDFTITTGAYQFSKDRFQFGDRFFTDIASRRLTYLGRSKYPICALFRTKKYQERGYKLPGSTVMHISLSIVRLEITTYKELKQQLLGIDTIYLQDLLNNEKYDEALPVDYGTFIADAFEHLNIYQQENEDDQF